MGRLADIENFVAGGLNPYLNLKILVRGRPRYLDPQLEDGSLRFAIKRGFEFSGIAPDNVGTLIEDAVKDSDNKVLT